MLLWILAASLGVAFYLKSRTPNKVVVPSPGPHAYNLRTLKGPHVNGGALRFFANLFEIPFLDKLLVYILFRTNLFHSLRHLQLKCEPTFNPLIHDFEKDAVIDHSTKLSAEEFLQRESDNVEKGTNEVPIFTRVSDYARAYRKGTILPSEVAKKVLQSIKENNNSNLPLRAIINILEDDVMQQAKQADERIKAGKPLSIFDGVPITVKDEFDQKGHPTTCGTAYCTVVAQEDAAVARKMRERGAILIGKANMHEIGISTFGFNPHHGTPRNPYNLQHHTGGSSAGSAAAVGSGLVPFAVGADGGGSIRVPAGICGAVGLKATYGRVSEIGAFPLCWTVAHAGPIASNVRDCALGYAVLAGVDPADRNTVDQPPVIVPNLDEVPSSLPLQGLRIGVYSEWFDHAAPEVVKSCRSALDILKSLGGTIVELPVLDGILEYSRVAHTIVITTEMGAAIAPYYEDPAIRKKFGLDVQISLKITSGITGRDYVQANRIRTLAIEATKELFSKVDIIASPTTARPAPRINTPDGKEDMDVEVVGNLMRFAFLANFTGIPGISVPCGYTPEGLPIGFQMMGRWWEEHTLIKAAYALEQHVKKQAPSKLFSHLG